MGDIQLANGTGSSCKQIAEGSEARDSFTGGDGRGHSGRNCGESINTLRPTRLFEKIQTVGFQGLCELKPHRRRRPGMAVNHDINRFSNGLAHGGHSLLCCSNRLQSFQRQCRRNGHRLERRESILDRLTSKVSKSLSILGRCLIEVFHFSPTQMAVCAHVVSDRSAPQLRAGKIGHLPKNVP